MSALAWGVPAIIAIVALAVWVRNRIPPATTDAEWREFMQSIIP